MKKFIISIDAGTTSNRSILFDLKGKLINYSIIGVGINVNQKKFKDLPNATSLLIPFTKVSKFILILQERFHINHFQNHTCW